MMQPSASIAAVPNEYSSAPEQRRHHDVASRLEPAVDADAHPVAQVVLDEGLLGVGETELPRHAGVLDRRQRRRTGAAVAARDLHHVGERLHDAGGDGADAVLGDELHRHLGQRVDLLEVVDELGEVLDRVDVVVRRRRDQPDPRLRVAQARDLAAHLVARQLTALPRLRSLGDLDVELVRERAVLGRHPEPARRDLLDARVAVPLRPPGPVAGRVLAALAAVALAPEHVHRDRERLVRLRRQRAVRHGAGREPSRDRLDRLHLLDRDGLTAGNQVEQIAQLGRRS